MNHKLKFTKFVDVLSPLGINQQNLSGIVSTYPNVGVDLYMPKFTEEFINEIIKANDGCILQSYINEPPEEQFFEIYRDGEIVMYFEQGKYYINDKIQIPSGIGILIPTGYHLELLPKSSAFHNEFELTLGLIDACYTYGFGFQFKTFSKIIEIAPDQKVSQFVVRKSEIVSELEEVKLTDWDCLKEIEERRIIRTGGFGSTGKFEKVSEK